MVESYAISLIVSNIFTAYTIKRLFSMFFEKGKSNTTTMITYLIFWVEISVCSVFVDIPIVNMISIIIGLLIVSLAYNTTIYKRILISSLYVIISFAMEIVVSVISGRVNIDPLTKGEYKNILGLFVCKMLIFLFVLLMEKADIHKGKNAPPLSFFIAAIFAPLASIAIGILVADTAGISEFTVIFTIVFLMIINIVTFSLYDTVSFYLEQQIENIVLKNEIAFYNNQFLLMKNSVDGIRKIRHDINNHFLALLGFLNENNLKAAESYLRELVDAEREIKKLYVDTGNIVVDSLLNYKLAPLADKNISPDVEVFVPYDLPIDESSFVVIITNLLDNAIEAIEKCAITVEKTFKLRMFYRSGILTILIQNSFSGKVNYSDDKIVSTKETEGHGYGIENIREAVDKYKGVLDLKHEKELFTAKVLLYID